MFGVPIELVVGGLVLAGLGLLTALLLAERSSGRRVAQRRRHPPSAAVPAPRPPVQVTEPDGPLPFAEPGMRGRLFQYGGDGPGFPVDAPYAVIDVETTGFSPAAGDRIVEVAIARVCAHGRIEDEYATLVDPGRDVGPVFVHGISNTEVLGAPTFADIAGELLDRMDGAVVVAHNATFEERLARRTLQAPNHKLTTLVRATALSTAGAHTALGDVRTVAALLPQMLAAHGEPLRYLTGLRRLPALDRGAPPRTRAIDLRTGTGGWLSAMMARLPMSAAEAREADVQRYLDALTVALADGRIVGGEAQQLARLAGSAGLGATQVASLHRRFLEHMRAAALEDAILTTGEIRQLKTAASGLGLPDYFDDLRPTSPQDVLAARLR
jgi:DNA polymerase III epsilon subunit-like protein